MTSIGKESRYFCWVGQYLQIVEGHKSPRQNLIMKLCYVEAPSALQGPIVSGSRQRQLRLGKALQQQMMNYLNPQDWVRVVGKAKPNKRSGELEFKALEIVKLSSVQVSHIKQIITAEADASPVQSPIAESSERKPIRIMICQKSSCRKKGSKQIADAIASAISPSQTSPSITVQAIGCLKNCKAGPNLVVLPKHQARDCGLKSRHNSVTPKRARKLVAQLQSRQTAVK